MRTILLFLGLISSVQLFAQANLQKGYIIINNQKTECLIKNKNWLHTPTEISYKLSANSPILTKKTSEIQELEIYKTNEKYILAEVETLQQKTEKRFLKCLVIGNASLYYENSTKAKFFFKTNNSKITELIYNESIKDDQVYVNNSYKQQLAVQLKCNPTLKTNIVKSTYNKKSLSNIFKKYNNCKGAEYTTYEQQSPKGKLSLSFLGGTSPFSIGNESFFNTKDKGTSVDTRNIFTIGADIEYRLPFNSYKWGIFSEVNFSFYKSTGKYFFTSDKVPSRPGICNIEIPFTSKFTTLEIPVGIRYYSFINPKNSLFYSAALSYNMTVTTAFDTPVNDSYLDLLEMENNLGFHLGVGYKYKSQFGIEIRYLSTSQFKRGDLSEGNKCILILLSYNLN